MRIADEVAYRFGNDGLCFTDDDGIDLIEACLERSALIERGRTWPDENGDLHALFDPSGDLMRLLFPDGSAIVIACDAWDTEGRTPFSWESLE